jgi:Mn-dependent DtxR family transcriptional regulator
MTRRIDQAMEWFAEQEVDVTIVDLMQEMDWSRPRAKGVLRILARKGLIKKTVQGDINNPTLWTLA